MKRSECIRVGRGGEGLVRGVGIGPGGVVTVDDDRVDALVRPFELLDVGFDDIARARLAGADRTGEVDGGALGQRAGWRVDCHCGTRMYRAARSA